MDATALGALVSMLQDHVQEAADALKKVANDNLSTDSCLAGVDLNRELLEVDSIASDLEQLVFQVEDALISGGVPNQVGNVDNMSVAVDEEASGSKDIDDDDVLPAD